MNYGTFYAVMVRQASRCTTFPDSLRSYGINDIRDVPHHEREGNVSYYAVRFPLIPYECNESEGQGEGDCI